MATRTIETNIVLGGEKEFNASMKSINSNLAVMRSDMAAVSAAFDENAGSIESLTTKQKLLDASAEQQAEKARVLAERYEAVAKAYGEDSAQADKAKIAMNQAAAASAKAAAAAEKNAEALSKAREESSRYVTIGGRIRQTINDEISDFRKVGQAILEAARNTPVLAEGLELAEGAAKALGLASKGAQAGVKGLGVAAKGAGTAAAGLAKGVGAITAASAAGVVALGALGVVGMTTMANFAKESAEAAKAAQEALEAGETLPESQQKWLEFAGQLDELDASVASAKSALGGVLLPMLSELSVKGGELLNNFSQEMEAAAGDTQKQGEIMGKYIAEGALLIKEQLPQYIEAGKELFSGLADGLEEEGPAILDMALDVCFDLLDTIIQYAPQMGQAGMQLIQKLTESLGERGPDLITSAVQMVTKIVTGLAQAAPDMIPAAMGLVTQLLTALLQAAPDLLLAGLELVLGIISGITNGMGDIINSADAIIESIVGAFTARADDFLRVGSKIIEQLKSGISTAWDGLVSWFNGIWNDLFGNRDANINVNVNKTESGNSHATGLSYVPYDNYAARLHEGEMVLTRSQANLYRRGYRGGVAASGEAEGGGKTANLYFYTKTITEAELNMVVDIVNRKLGDAL